MDVYQTHPKYLRVHSFVTTYTTSRLGPIRASVRLATDIHMKPQIIKFLPVHQHPAEFVHVVSTRKSEAKIIVPTITADRPLMVHCVHITYGERILGCVNN